MTTNIVDVLERNKLDHPPIFKQVLVLLTNRNRAIAVCHTPIMTVDEIKAAEVPLLKTLIGAYTTFQN